MMTDIKTYRFPHGPAIRCRCGLIFIGLAFRQTWSAHTWDCEEYKLEREKIFNDTDSTV